MKILYFTGTGNSLSVAKQLADNDSDIINIASCNEKCIKDNSIGIVFPVFCYDLPFIVENFLINTQIESDYIWAIATCGSSVGHSFQSIKKLLKKQGRLLSYSKKIVLPDSCIIFKTSEDKKQQMLGEQDDTVASIKLDITSKQITEKPYKDRTLRIRTISWFFLNNIIGIKNKQVNNDCDKCNICVKICPVNNIKMENKPVFLSECENCFACIQWCPKQAITFGKLKIDQSSKYNHPSIKISELINRNKDQS